MYFCKDENVYKPNKGQMLYSFCADMIKKLRDLHRNNPDEKIFAVLGKFNEVYITARTGDTINGLADFYHRYCNREAPENDIHEPCDRHALYGTMTKIQTILLESDMEYWLSYDPKNKTYIVKFGKELNLEEE